MTDSDNLHDPSGLDVEIARANTRPTLIGTNTGRISCTEPQTFTRSLRRIELTQVITNSLDLPVPSAVYTVSGTIGEKPKTNEPWYGKFDKKGKNKFKR